MKNIPGEIVKAAGILLMTSASDQPQFLLLRHPKRWDLPKGHCEPGESFQDTALRETEEETGLPRQSISLDADFRFDLVYPVTYRRWGERVFEKHVRYFLGYVETPPALQLTEHESARWFLWNPPHQIQSQTIDPLLAAVADHVGRRP